MTTPKVNSNIISNIEYPNSKKWDVSNNLVTLDFKNVSSSVVNAIRRTIISQVKSAGFRTEPYEKCQVEILQNDTPLHNQFMTHRIGMIPINIPNVDTFDFDDYEFILDVNNTTNFPKDITTKDIKIRKVSEDRILNEKETRTLIPPDPNSGDYILISRLKPKYYKYAQINNETVDSIRKELGDGQVANTLRFYMKAKCCASNGEENGSFNPSCAAFYINKVDENKAKIAEKEYVDVETEKYVKNNLKPLTESELQKRFRTSHYARYFHTDKNGEPNWFTFTVESVGVIPPLVLIHRSLNILKSKVQDLKHNLSIGDESKVEISPSPELVNGFLIVIDKEDDTLGNLVQTHLSNLYANYTSTDRILNYIGYVRQHPLIHKINMTIQPKIEMKWEAIMDNVISPGCASIIKLLNKMIKEIEDSPQFMQEMKRVKSNTL
jgi:DNA-directed RNA polymerase subunit L